MPHSGSQMRQKVTRSSTAMPASSLPARRQGPAGQLEIAGIYSCAAPLAGTAAPDPKPESCAWSNLSNDLPRAKALPAQRASRARCCWRCSCSLLARRDRGAVGWPDTCCRSPPRRRRCESLKPIDQGTSSAVYAADGTRLGFIQSDEIRTPIPLQRIPESMQAATVAIEDERFYRARRRRLRGHRARRLQEPRGRQGRRGRLDDHAAARAQPVRRPRAHAGAQDPRGAPGRGAGGRALQALDPARAI